MSQRSNMEILIEMYCHATVEEGAAIQALQTTPKTIFEDLAKAGVRYTWETVNDYVIGEYFRAIEVRLYVPGNMLYGRYSYDTRSETFISLAHNYAVYDAFKTVSVGTYSVVAKEEPTVEQKPQMSQSQQANSEKMQPSQALTPDEIMNIVQQNTQAVTQPTAEPIPITTAEQMKNDIREEIPFNEVNLDDDELNKLLTGQTNSNPVPQQQNTSTGFTQEQINAMVDFRTKNNISNDEMFGSYVNAWNNKLSKKTDITPANVDLFIQWTYTLGKAPY